MRARWFLLGLAGTAALLAAVELALPKVMRGEAPQRSAHVALFAEDEREEDIALEAPTESTTQATRRPQPESARARTQRRVSGFLAAQAEARAGAETPAVVPPGPPVTLHGIVLDDRGVPLEGVRVELRGRMGSATAPSTTYPTKRIYARTDEHGTFDFTSPARFDLAITIQHDGFRRLEQALGDLASGAHLPDVALRLDGGVAIAGRVHHADGSPARSAHLRASRARATPGDLRTHRTTLREDGTFEFRGLDPGAYTVQVETFVQERDEPGGSGRVRKLYARAEDVKSETQGVELVLQHDFVLAGTVADVSGAPIREFGLRIRPCGDAHGGATVKARHRSHRTFTDDAGRFALDDVPQGCWTIVVVTEAGGRAWRTHLAVDRDILDVRFVAEMGQTLRGRVVEPGGAGVRSASILVGLEDERLGPYARDLGTWRAKTDDEGRFEVHGLLAPPGTPGRIDARSSDAARAATAAFVLVDDLASKPVVLELADEPTKSYTGRRLPESSPDTR
jgi:uncharacterized GH25 family protein